jgi:hypothetical protein
VLLAFVTSCGTGHASEAGFFFPTHDASDAPSSQAFGRLAAADQCVILADSTGGPNHLPIWPTGFFFDGRAVRDGEEAIVAELGQDLELEGGEVSGSVASDLIGADIPERCASAVPFIVSGVQRP